MLGGIMSIEAICVRFAKRFRYATSCNGTRFESELALRKALSHKGAARAMRHSTLRQLGPIEARHGKPGRTDTLFLNSMRSYSSEWRAFDVIRGRYGAYQWPTVDPWL